MDCSGDICILEKRGENPEYQVGKGRFFLDNGCYFPLKKSVKSITKSTRKKSKNQSGQGKIVRKGSGLKHRVKQSKQTGSGSKKKITAKKSSQTGKGKLKSKNTVSLKIQRGKGYKKLKRLKTTISHKKTTKRPRTNKK